MAARCPTNVRATCLPSRSARPPTSARPPASPPPLAVSVSRPYTSTPVFAGARVGGHATGAVAPGRVRVRAAARGRHAVCVRAYVCCSAVPHARSPCECTSNDEVYVLVATIVPIKQYVYIFFI